MLTERIRCHGEKAYSLGLQSKSSRNFFVTEFRHAVNSQPSNAVYLAYTSISSKCALLSVMHFLIVQSYHKIRRRFCDCLM